MFVHEWKMFLPKYFAQYKMILQKKFFLQNWNTKTCNIFKILKFIKMASQNFDFLEKK